MTHEDIEYIEASLDVVLPEPYKRVMTDYPFEDGVGDFNHSPGDCARSVVKWTRTYWGGFGCNPPWPRALVCIGTEGDACPIALNLKTLKVVKFYKGNFRAELMEEYDSFECFIEQCVKDYAEE